MTVSSPAPRTSVRSMRGLFVSTLSSQKRTAVSIERLPESDGFLSISRTLCGVRILAETWRSNGAPYAWTTRRPTRLDPNHRRSVAEQARFRGSNRMLPAKGGRFTPIRARNAARAGPRWFRPRPRRRRQHSRRSSSSEAEKASRLLAGLIARQAHSANLRPEGINRARRRHADLTDQSGAAISFATHATVIVIDEESRNPIELGIALRREPRPIRRKRTARAASPARRPPVIERVNGIEYHRPRHLRTVHHAASHGGTVAIFVESPCESPDRFSRQLLVQGRIDHCPRRPGRSASSSF